MPAINKDISIVLCGEAGQGIQTVENALVRLMKASGFHVFASKEYMSRIRGGANSTQIRAGRERMRACLDRIDLLIPLNRGALERQKPRISEETVLMGESGIIDIQGPGRKLEVPLARLAAEAGGQASTNMAALGAVAGLLALEPAAVELSVRAVLAGKDPGLVAANLAASANGLAAGREFLRRDLFRPPVALKGPDDLSGEMFISGAEAVGLGALAGGCDFVSSYPMSPSTGVLTFLAGQAVSFGLIVEQAEDEISAVNMALGAWYAGARAMVTTSGGGFALMVEGLSLAGMLESPLVVHLGQRPGPATGLPTRTEQADLDFVRCAGHGEFPRAILAPGSLEEAFELSRAAFDLAARHQIPVFILTDQFLLDSTANLPAFTISAGPSPRHVVATAVDYRRFAFSPDGLSPRGVPGFGQGLVCVDSDEHDEEGHLTEDLSLRKRMVEKRLRKGEAAAASALSPRWSGPPDAETAVVSWGSTGAAVLEALALLGRPDLAHVHFAQVHPIAPGAGELLGRARRRIAVEGNATGQFRRQLESVAGVRFDASISKYDGSPFSVEEVSARLREIDG